MYDLLLGSWSRSAPALKCTICCRCLGLEGVPQHEGVRFVAGVLVSKWCPITKIYDLLMVSLYHGGGPAQRCAICWRCLGLLPVSWSRSGAPRVRCTICFFCVLVSKLCSVRRCTICRRCLGLEVVLRTKMHDLSPVSWSRSGDPATRCMICCRSLGLEVVPQHEDIRDILISKWCPSSKMNDLLPLLVSNWCASTQMYKLLPVSWSRSGAPTLRCAICCRCLGFEVVHLLPVAWSRSGAPALRCTICCRCLSLGAMPQN